MVCLQRPLYFTSSWSCTESKHVPGLRKLLFSFCFVFQPSVTFGEKKRTAILPKALCAVQTTALILFMLVPNVLENPRATFKSENSM